MEGDIDFISAQNIDISFEDSNGLKQRGILTIDPQATRVLSDSKTAYRITTFEDDERIKEHQRYFEDFIEDLPAGITYFLFDASVVVNRIVISLPSVVSVPSGPVAVELFRNATITDNGTELDTVNPAEGATFVHQGKFYQGPAVSNEGTKISGKTFGTEGGFFTSANGGSGGASQPGKVKTNLLLKINNTSGGIVDYINRFFSWFEVPEE